MRDKIIEIQESYLGTSRPDTLAKIADEILELFDEHTTDGSPCWCNPAYDDLCDKPKTSASIENKDSVLT